VNRASRQYGSVWKPSPLARLLAYGTLCLGLLAGPPAAANPELGAALDLASVPRAQLPALVARLAAGGARSVRLPLDWNEVQPTRGSFRWQRYDEAVAAARAAGLEVVLVLGPAARWSVDPALGLTPALQPRSLPKSLTVWEDYARRAATRYRGQATYWQVREQPNGANFRGAVWPEYARLLQAAAQTVRAVNPADQIVLPESIALDPSGMDRWLHAPEAAYWRVYGAYLPAPPNLARSALRLAVMAGEVNPPDARSSRPVWVLGAEGPLSPDAWLQYYLLAAAFGVSRVYLPADLLDPAWSPQLSALQYVGSLRLGPNVWALTFQDREGAVVAAWSGIPLSLPAAELAPVADAAQVAQAAYVGAAPGSAAAPGPAPAVRLGPRPALIRGLDVAPRAHPGIPSRAQVLAGRGKPDLSLLPAVSVDYGRPDQPELGLYHQALRGLPGGASRLQERDGRLALGTALDKHDPQRDQPWLYFDVDDSWLYFAHGRTRVEITVECQAPAQPGTVGFMVRYDSTRGAKNTRWQWLSPGSGWQRCRVVLDDADFTGRPGYDFLIDAAASKEDLWVASVTVRKLPGGGDDEEGSLFPASSQVP
jgi:hypothetical protein